MAKRRRILTQAANSPREQSRHHRRKDHTAWWVAGAFAFVLIVTAAVLVGQLGSPAPALPAEVTAAQAFERYQAGALFLDVRTAAEWDQGHIAESVLIPLDELSNRLGELPRDRDIVVVCRSGARSTEGAQILRNAGFTRVTCLSGGLQSWIAAGYPLGN